MTRKILHPAGWPRPNGYSNGITATGRLVFTAGIVGWNENEKFDHKDIAGQFRQILVNTQMILAEAGANPGDIVRMTCFVTDKRQYVESLSNIGRAWRDIFGKIYPCMSVVEVAGLIENEAMIEIETTAVVNE